MNVELHCSGGTEGGTEDASPTTKQPIPHNSQLHSSLSWFGLRKKSVLLAQESLGHRWRALLDHSSVTEVLKQARPRVPSLFIHWPRSWSPWWQAWRRDLIGRDELSVITFSAPRSPACLSPDAPESAEPARSLSKTPRPPSPACRERDHELMSSRTNHTSGLKKKNTSM